MQEVGCHCLEALLAKTHFLSSVQETWQKRLIPLENISGIQREPLYYLKQNYNPVSQENSVKYSETIACYCLVPFGGRKIILDDVVI